MLGERELYEQLKEYYDILGIDENVDEIKLKKAYRFAAKNIIQMEIQIIKKQKKNLFKIKRTLWKK